jgi:KUP system potassium uptake protein
MMLVCSAFGILGLIQITKHPEVFKAFNPYYAYNLLSIHPDGFLFWDLYFCVQQEQKHVSAYGHCVERILELAGFCKTTLVLTTLDKRFLIHHEGETLQNRVEQMETILSYNG